MREGVVASSHRVDDGEPGDVFTMRGSSAEVGMEAGGIILASARPP
jgi:hypothetical protein